MANREALRELHSRLATRLQAARSGDVAASWLAVVCGGFNYLFPLSQAGEIFPWSPAIPVPYSQNWFMGVTNLRGGLYGVVDLAAFIATSPRPALAELSSTESRLVTFNPALDINCGLLVDRLAGLRHLDAFLKSEAPPPDSPDFMGAVYTTPDGASWQEVNLQILSRQPQFLSISA